MNKLTMLVATAAIVGGIVFFGPQLSEVFNSVSVEQHTVIEEKEVEVDNIQKRVEEAQEAARSDIEAAAQAEYDAVYKAEMSKVKAIVLKEIEDELAAERAVVEAEVQAY